MKLAVAYCRVSTDKEEQKKSITEQKKQWEEFFEDTGTEPAKCGLLYKKDGTSQAILGGIYADEGLSGTSLKNRRAFNLMIEDAKLKKFDMIYVEDTSRFSRSVEDCIKTVKDLRQLGIGVFFRKEGWDTLNENKDFELSLRISIAQEESRVKSERLKWAINRLHKNGGWNSTAPYGYNIVNAHLEINEEEAEIVRCIFDLYTNEGYGTGKIARFLNQNNILTKKGCKWSQPQISSILDNRLYIGEQRTHTVESADITRQYQKNVPLEEQIVHNFEHLIIIDNEKFNLAQLERNRRKEQFSNGNGHSNKHLLSTLLYCAHCGSTFKRKKRHTYKRIDGTSKDLGYEWTCIKNDMYGKDVCSHRNSLIEDDVIKIIKDEILYRKENDLSGLFEKYCDIKFSLKDLDLSKLTAEKNKLMAEQRQLRKDKTDIPIDESIYREEMQILNKSIGDVNADISRIERKKIEQENANLRFEEYKKMLSTLDFDKLTNTQLKKIFNKIQVKERKKQIYLGLYYNFLDTTEDEVIEHFEDNNNNKSGYDEAEYNYEANMIVWIKAK